MFNKQADYPPGPPCNFWGVGLFAANRRDPLKFMREVTDAYGDIVYFRVGHENIYLINRPEYVHETLVTHGSHLVKGRGGDRSKLLLGEGLLTTAGQAHRQQRKIEQPAFHRSRIAAYAEVMVAETEAMSATWRDAEAFDDIGDEMRHMTMAIISRTMFGEFDPAERDELSRALRRVLTQYTAFPHPLVRRFKNLPLPRVRRWRDARHTLEAAMQRRIDARRRDDAHHDDLLAMMLDAQREADSNTLDDNVVDADRRLRDELLTIFIAGFETVSLMLMFTWYLLARHPDVEARLHRELDDVLEGGRAPVAADVPRLPYTEMILNEALRLYPPAWRLVRCVIKPYEVGGYTIPAGALVIVSQYLMHRDERFYNEPHRFDPERWTPEARSARPPYAFFPFGGGARTCIGDRFAMMEGVLLLATIARRWRLRVPARYEIELQPRHTLGTRRGVPAVLELRN